MKQILVITIVVTMGLSAASSQAQVTRGRELLLQGKAGEALMELRSVVELSPKSAEAWGLMGQAYAGVNRADSAVIAGRKSLSFDDECAEGYVALSQGYVLEKNLSEAYKTLYKGLRKRKGNAAMLMQLGSVHVAADSLDQAILALSLAKEGDPNNIVIYSRLGDVYMRQPAGATMAAIQYEKATEIDSTDADLYYKLSQAFMKDRRYNDAADALIKVVNHDPGNTRAMLEVATLYYKGKLWKNAGIWLGMFLEKVPNNAAAQAWYMEALYMDKQYKDALDVAQKVVAANRDNKLAIRIIAQSAFEVSEFTTAIEYYGRLQAVDSISVPDLKRIARAHLEMKNDSLAIAPLEEIIRRDPATTDILGLLGSLYVKTKQYDKASSLYATQMEREPDNANLLFQYVTTNMYMERWEPAQIALAKFLEKETTNIRAHLYLAKTLYYMQRNKDAQKEYQTVIELAKDSADKYSAQLIEAYAVNGFYYLLDKNYNKALENLNASIKMKDDIAPYRLWRAQTLINLGKKDEAIREYKAAIKLDPTNAAAKKELDMIQSK